MVKDVTPTPPPPPAPSHSTPTPSPSPSKGTDVVGEHLRAGHRSHADKQKALDDMEPFVDEQRSRSRRLEILGVHHVVMENDQRPEELRPVLHEGTIAGGPTLDTPVAGQKQVPGVNVPRKEDGSITR
jgi:hypothetical protein